MTALNYSFRRRLGAQSRFGMTTRLAISLLVTVTAGLLLLGAPTGLQAEPPSSRVTRFTIGPPSPTRQARLSLGRQPITLDVRQADVRQVLRLFAERSGVNIVVSPEVEGSVTLSLKRVPLQEAFMAVLDAHHLTWERVGQVVMVSRREQQ
ncbi:MAG: secretin and TonB N-terminal domain-containing protein [Myxococcota bacterium]